MSDTSFDFSDHVAAVSGCTTGCAQAMTVALPERGVEVVGIIRGEPGDWAGRVCALGLTPLLANESALIGANVKAEAPGDLATLKIKVQVGGTSAFA